MYIHNSKKRGKTRMWPQCTHVSAVVKTDRRTYMDRVNTMPSSEE